MGEDKTTNLLVFLFVVIFLLFTVGAQASTSQQSAASRIVPEEQKSKTPRIAMDVTVFDLGTVTTEEEVSAKFDFQNVGDETLEIYFLEPKSENVSAVLSARTFDPGESGHIEVTVHTERLQGPVVGKVSVITSDREHREIMLEVRAKIQPLLTLNPPFIWAGQIGRESSYKNKVRLAGKIIDDGGFSSLTIDEIPPGVSADIVYHNIKGKKIAYLEFVLLHELRAGTFRESVTVISSDPPAKTQLILYGHKLGVVEVIPDRFDFFPRDDMEPDVRIVRLESDKEFHIKRAAGTLEKINISIEIIEEGKKYELIAKLNEPAKASFIGVIKVYTDLEEYPIIDIPVIGGPKEQ